MSDDNIRQVPAGRKALVVGIANDVTGGTVYLDRGANIFA
jgi:hypothetical protein